MTSFNTLFNRMFQEKSRAVYLIYLIQAFSSLCFSLWMIFSMRGEPNVMMINGHREVTNHLNDLQMSGTLVAFLLFDVVVTLIDILLLNKFVEAKQN